MTLGNPSAVWTVKGSHKEGHDRYIVVSFTNASLVLSIGDTVEEVTDSGESPYIHSHTSKKYSILFLP